MKIKNEITTEHISVMRFFGDESNSILCGDHCHDKYEITCLLCASGRYIVEGGEHKVSEGSILMIKPMSYHKVELNLDAPIEGYTIYFSKSAINGSLSDMLNSIFLNEELHSRFYPSQNVSEAVLSVFERFSMADKLDGGAKESYMQALLSEIIILLASADSERMNASQGSLGARVTRYINSNYKKNISLDRLARRFFVSKYYLCRAFKEYSGISVHAYINQKRIVYAKSLIDSGMTAVGAAEKVGYGDYSAFYRAYVKIIGKSPTAE